MASHEFVTKRPTTSFCFTLSDARTISALIHLGSISLDLRLLPRVVILEHSSGHCFRRLFNENPWAGFLSSMHF